MNILFLDSVQDFGGSQISTISLINNIKVNHSIKYVDFWGSDGQLIQNLKNNNINHSVLDYRPKPIIIANNFFLFKFKNFFKFLINKITLKKELQIIIKEFEPDFIVVNNIKSLSIIKKKNFKIIYFERTWISNKSKSVIKQIILNKVDYYFAVSHASKNAIHIHQSIDLSKIYVIHNSIKIANSLKKHEIPLNFINILNCGGYIKSKGLHLTLKIAQKLKFLNINFHINIVGVVYQTKESQDYFKSLNDYIIQNHLEKYVTLNKNVTEISNFYEEADILIHPTYTEGLPRVIMEAMSYSIPVISNPVGGVNDFIIDRFTGFLVNYNDIDDFVNKIILLKEDTNLYKEITRNAYNMIKKSFNDKIQKEKLLNILNQLK